MGDFKKLRLAPELLSTNRQPDVPPDGDFSVTCIIYFQDVVVFIYKNAHPDSAKPECDLSEKAVKLHTY